MFIVLFLCCSVFCCVVTCRDVGVVYGLRVGVEKFGGEGVIVVCG